MCEKCGSVMAGIHRQMAEKAADFLRKAGDGGPEASKLAACARGLLCALEAGGVASQRETICEGLKRGRRFRFTGLEE